MRFRTTVLLGGKSATGILVPAEVVTALDSGRQPKVQVTVGGHTYRSSIGVRGGQFMIPLSADNRSKAGVAAGDEIDVELELDTAPREVEVPADLVAALAGDAEAQRIFDGLSFTHRKEYVRWIEEAKKAETRQTRVAKTLLQLKERA
jgi:hypothetical protein